MDVRVSVLEEFDPARHGQVQLLDLLACGTQLPRHRTGELADVVYEVRLVEVATRPANALQSAALSLRASALARWNRNTRLNRFGVMPTSVVNT